MRRISTVSALIAATLAAGCGSGQSEDAKLLAVRRGFCQASPGATVSALSAQWGYLPNVLVDCETNHLPPNGDCDLTVLLCRMVWQEFIFIDSSLCGTNGCTYKCDAFAPAPAGTGAGFQVSAPADSVICSASFAQGQP